MRGDQPKRSSHRMHTRCPRTWKPSAGYSSAAEGGVSHFRYGRDNALLTCMYARLMLEFVLRLPALIVRRLLGRPPFAKR